MLVDVAHAVVGIRGKVCRKCGEWKPIEAYSKKLNGTQPVCRVCDVKRVTASYDPDKRREYNRAYRAANKEAIAVQGKEYRDANKDRIREREHAFYMNHRDEMLARDRAYRERNRDRIIEWAREYREANREKIRESDRAAYPLRKEQIAARLRAWRKTERGRDADRAKAHRRRAQKIASGTLVTTEDLSAIRAAQTDKRGRLICWRCRKPINGTPDLDHFIPLSRGGLHTPGNLHFMHARCNRSKHAKHPHDLGMLI